MTPEEIDDTARLLRHQAGQTERYVRLGPILALVNAEVRVDRNMPGPVERDGVYYRQLDGLCIRGKLKFYIYVNGKDTATTRRRFTIAHEIGHAVMHDADCSLFSNVPHLQDQPEIEANRFAGYLLIDSELLAADLRTTASVSALASLYGVSPQAMERAIKERGRQP